MSIKRKILFVTDFSYVNCIVAHAANVAGIPKLHHEENSLSTGTGPSLVNELVGALRNQRLRDMLPCDARKTFENSFSEPVATGLIAEKIGQRVESK
jgi:hypothetical protein